MLNNKRTPKSQTLPSELIRDAVADLELVEDQKKFQVEQHFRFIDFFKAGYASAGLDRLGFTGDYSKNYKVTPYFESPTYFKWEMMLLAHVLETEGF
jgi:hypothetical protein